MKFIGNIAKKVLIFPPLSLKDYLLNLLFKISIELIFIILSCNSKTFLFLLLSVVKNFGRISTINNALIYQNNENIKVQTNKNKFIKFSIPFKDCASD